MKKMIAIIIAILLITTLSIVIYFSNQSTPNDENAIGNTAGNLYNGGLFCEDNGKIYFSNPKDSNSLYVMNSDMTHYKKLYGDETSYINVTNKYLVYARNNHRRKTSNSMFLSLNRNGIVRITKKDGKSLKMLYGKPTGLVSLKGNYVYYQHYNSEEGIRFHRVGLDASKDIMLSEDPVIPASFSGNYLYYNGAGNDHSIYAMDLESTRSEVVYAGNSYNVMVNGDYMYFLSLSNDYAIARTDLDGNNPEIIVNERCSSYNITLDGEYLYYQVDGGDNNRFCRLNLSTLESETIVKGDYNSIHVTENYVFFRAFNASDFQYITNSSGEIKTFNPKVMEQ